MCAVASDFEGVRAMSDYVWTTILTLGLLGYLVYALLRPEKF